MINIRPPIEFSVTPPRVRISPRPAGYDPATISWEEKPDVIPVGNGHVYEVIPPAGNGKL